MPTPTASDPTPDEMPQEAYAVALASVPGIGPRTLRALLADKAPRAAWEALVSGDVRLPASRQSVGAFDRARRIDVAAVWRAHVDAGVGVRTIGQPGYPSALAADPEAPAILFSLGSPQVVDGAPRVAIVGTRSATRYGLGVAAQLGADLAAAGVVVVSGLALGIDGAAHEGAVAAWRAACGDVAFAGPARDSGQGPGEDRAPPVVAAQAAPPVAVVAGSVATPYPRQHAGLWRRVADAGAVLSESPIGAADLAWRFPMRNRIIAAISDVVVVVECHHRGGSLHTVQAAAVRGVPVGAVPGSVRSPASAGTNALLADGCFVVRDVSDVLVAVGLSVVSTRLSPFGALAAGPGSAVATGATGAAGAAAATRTAAGLAPGGTGLGDLPPPTRAVADAVGWERASLDEILERTDLPMDEVCAALERLSARGVVVGEGGCWERLQP